MIISNFFYIKKSYIYLFSTFTILFSTQESKVIKQINFSLNKKQKFNNSSKIHDNYATTQKRHYFIQNVQSIH